MFAVVCLVNFNGLQVNMTDLVECVLLPQLGAVAIVLVPQLPVELRHGIAVDEIELQHATELVALAIVARTPEVKPNVLGYVAMELDERDGLAPKEPNALRLAAMRLDEHGGPASMEPNALELAAEPGPGLRCVALEQLLCDPVKRI